MIIKLFNYFKIKKTAKEIDEDIHFSAQQMSYAVACLLLIFFFIFMTGYYWGKKSAIESFAAQIESDSLSDKISYAFCSNYDYKGDQTESAQDETEGESNLEKSPNIVEVKEIKESKDLRSFCLDKNEDADIGSNIGSKKVDNNQYLAELAGFGSMSNARIYEKALAKNGHTVKIITRKSKTSKGREIKWYQVITQTYNNQNELLEEIKKIKKVAPIKDVKVVIIDQQKNRS